jgi:hypothetical protein
MYIVAKRFRFRGILAGLAVAVLGSCCGCANQDGDAAKDSGDAGSVSLVQPKENGSEADPAPPGSQRDESHFLNVETPSGEGK